MAWVKRDVLRTGGDNNGFGEGTDFGAADGGNTDENGVGCGLGEKPQGVVVLAFLGEVTEADGLDDEEEC